jgi:ribose transport system substrate-binding protein
MKRRHTLTLAAGLMAVALTTASCSNAGSAAAPDEALSLAGIGFAASDPYWITLMCAGSRVADEEGVELEWVAANSNAIAEQQANLDSQLLNDPDGVVLGAAQPEVFATQVGQLMSDGLPVTAPNGAIDTALQSFIADYESPEFFEYIAEQLGGESGTIGVLGGAAGIPPVDARWEGLVDALAETAPELRVLDVARTDFDRTRATTAAAAMITGNPDLRAIYAVSGPEGEGAAAAVEEAGLTGEVAVYAWDATPGEVEALRNGTITALLAQPAGLIGAEAVRTLIEYLRENPDPATVEPLDPATEVLPIRILTADNIDDDESRDYIYAPTCEN